MKKALLPILALLLALTLALPMALPVAAHGEGDPFEAFLVAGQNIDVGLVEVWNDGAFLHVDFVTDGWEITETHLAVATSLADIPQTGSGNPKVGQFPYKDPEGTYMIPLTWAPGTKLYIAAHAVVRCGCQEETAWAWQWFCDGTNWVRGEFPGNNWATYFQYEVQ